MTEPTAAHARDLGDYVSLARRRWPWIVASLVVGVVLSLLYLSTAPQTFVSTAKVLVEATSSATTSVGARTNDAINLDTEAQLVRSEPVSTRAADLLDSPVPPVRLSQGVTVTVPPNTTVMAISFAAPSAEEAQRGAAMFAQAYLEHRQGVAQDELAADVARLEGQIAETTQEIQDASVAMVRLDGTNQRADRALLAARRSTLSAQLASYNGELAPLVGAVVDPGELILEAQLPKRPSDPDPRLILPAGLMAGLVLGLALAVWRERWDKRIHHPADVERLFGLAPLSALTAAGRGQTLRVDHDVRAFYHSLRANGPDLSEVVMLAGPDAADTAEHLAYSLALVAARSGSTTAYLTRPRSAIVRDRRRCDAGRVGSLQLLDYEDLGVIVDGEFRSANLRDELHTLSSTHDFLIVGMPNDDPGVDIPILGRHVDIAIVVVRLGVTRRDTLATVLADLSKSGVDKVVAVTVDLGRRRLSRREVSAGEVFAEAAMHSGPDRSPRHPAPGLHELAPRGDADLAGHPSRAVSARRPR